jgi:hypothetical protein
VMRQHNIWCVYVAFCVKRYVGLICCYAAESPQSTSIILKSFRLSDFNQDRTSSLKMIRITIGTGWSIFKCFNINILDYYIIVYRSATVGV